MGSSVVGSSVMGSSVVGSSVLGSSVVGSSIVGPSTKREKRNLNDNFLTRTVCFSPSLSAMTTVAVSGVTETPTSPEKMCSVNDSGPSNSESSTIGIDMSHV